MQSVVTEAHEVHFNQIAKEALNQCMVQKGYSKIFVLVDKNTEKLCLPKFEALFDHKIDEVICITPGEEHKHIHTCLYVWEQLSELGGDRKSLLINVGGGVVTDLGGFVACTFKRGIDFINIPTTLLAMVDASVGGKNGVDLGTLKNQVGVIQQPKMVLIFPEFLETLEDRQMISGFAEMLKHGLIVDRQYWKDLRTEGLSKDAESIARSVVIKSDIVTEDPKEHGIRKKLNFGHTLGHAIESFYLDSEEKETLLHGEAIAIGMVMEAFLAHKITGLSRVDLDEIKQTMLKYYPFVVINDEDIPKIKEYLIHDKKNSHGEINFVLLNEIGSAVVDVKIPDHLIAEAFAYYKLP
ncbi:3-dehydroquinate synthase [Flavobacterium sp. ASW18X]|uniref:3-dehydroquinate synthase n=1 Tax=Flavobacterium sp. ASW18X TaxID=2572595 RepID=UPI0010AED6E8|nr:3-dehydroquinate synthase [Flavobacterium sp. ASW18X]TKD66134.1 3-dehydroquinate synthase [Flavobacterium sp. ASW18X]